MRKWDMRCQVTLNYKKHIMIEQKKSNEANHPNWITTTLDAITIYISSGKSKINHNNGKYPLYGSTGIIGFDNKFDYEGNVILVARVGANAGTTNLVGGRYSVSDNTLIIKPNIENNITYLFYELKRQNLNKFIFGSGQPLITGSQLKQLTIHIPPLPEQKAIAQALSDVDDLISALDALIEKKRNIKQGTMQELLTGKRRLPGFSGEWEEKRLNEVANIIDPHPSHRAPPEQPNGIPFVGIGDVSINGVINKDTARFVGEYVYDEHKKRYDLNNGLIGIGRVASIGKIVKFNATEDKYTISPTIAVIESKSVNKDLLYYKLSSSEITDQFIKICSGSTRQSVGMHVLRELTLTVPKSAKEQLAISQLISNMDNEIERLEQQRDKTKLLKQGMMQELLTGKTRLL